MSTQIVYFEGEIIINNLISQIVRNIVNDTRWEKINLSGPATLFALNGKDYQLMQFAMEAGYQAGLSPECFVWQESESKPEAEPQAPVVYRLEGSELNCKSYIDRVLSDGFANFVEQSNKE